MKTASLPPLRVEVAVRRSAERLLRPGESLSAFVEEAVLRNIDRRRADAEFLARGLANRAEARQSGDYVTPRSALTKLERVVRRARRSQ